MKHELIGKKFSLLDDGFICLMDYMGSDEDIEQAARVSYGKGTRKVSDTRNLLRFLMRHHHSTPFEMAEVKLLIRCPLYVVRQWHRHRTWSYNEYSGRYSVMIDSMEKTKPDEWRTQSKSNKQGSGDFLSLKVGEMLSAAEDVLHAEISGEYEGRLKLGVAKEQARKDLPVSNYTEFFAKVDLKNLMHFMSLRCDSHAQLEIRVYADKITGMVKELFPITFQAWYDYHFQAVNFTRLDRLMLEFLLSRNLLDEYEFSGSTTAKTDAYGLVEKQRELSGMSKRELTEFWDKISVPTEQDFSL
jgi:thymidylate synthase (FAD)